MESRTCTFCLKDTDVEDLNTVHGSGCSGDLDECQCFLAPEACPECLTNLEKETQ